MKTSTIVGTISLVVIGVLSLVAWNAFKIDRKFVVLHNSELGFCFLVDDGYKYELSKESFTYGGGKNSGELKLVPGKLSADYKLIDINGFKGSYKKEKNKRIYEYQISENLKLVDHFVNAGKMPVNLVPYRDECKRIKENFKDHKEIFKGV